MRTSKPIATISYNTETFLINRLEELIRNRKICDYMYIKHFKEEDETKDHFHLWIKPNTLIDTMDIQDFMREFDMNDITKKPLGCIDFRSSKTDDWILYAQHDPAYLASKFESRKYIYTKEDFRYYDEDTFNDLYKHAHYGSEWAQRNYVLQALQSGDWSPEELILSGAIPFSQSSQLNAFMHLQNYSKKTDRGNHQGHDEITE